LYLAAFVFVDRLRLRHRQPQHPGRASQPDQDPQGLLQARILKGVRGTIDRIPFSGILLDD
jgi:hypothetical protein